MERDDRAHAEELFGQAYQRQMDGELDLAIELYTRSIELFPTAEAYTFRGWTYSFKGDYSRAIEECLRAIEVDPDYGNPYNDIGAYLIELGKADEAIEWLERALDARRYESYCFPHFNLGRAFERKRDFERARRCYRCALDANPRYRLAAHALLRLQAMYN